MALQFTNASTDKLTIPAATSIDDFSVFTIMMWVKVNTYADGRYYWGKRTDGAFMKQLRYLTPGGTATIQFGNIARATTNAQCSTTTGIPTAGNWAFLCGTYDEGGSTAGDTINLYLGSLTTPAAEVTYSSRVQGSGTTNADNTADFILGNQAPSGSLALAADYAFVAYINKYLSLSEIIQQQWRPFVLPETGLFMFPGFHGASSTQVDYSGNANNGTPTGLVSVPHVPLRSPFAFDRSYLTFAPVGAFTLAAGAGAYTLSGTAAGLPTTRLVNAAGGTYSLSGVTAGLFYGRAIDAEVGGYTLTGQPVGLTATRQLLVETGVYSVARKDVGLLYGRTIAAGSGIYTVTGANINALFGRLLTAGVGAYTLSGTDVTLTYSGALGAFVLTADVGSYSLSGSTAGLLAGRLLTAGEGSYVVTGDVLSLLKKYLLNVDGGSYIITGQDVTFPRTYILDVRRRTYAISGSSVTLTYSGALGGNVHYIVIRRRRRM